MGVTVHCMGISLIYRRFTYPGHLFVVVKRGKIRVARCDWQMMGVVGVIMCFFRVFRGICEVDGEEWETIGEW